MLNSDKSQETHFEELLVEEFVYYWQRDNHYDCIEVFAEDPDQTTEWADTEFGPYPKNRAVFDETVCFRTNIMVIGRS